MQIGIFVTSHGTICEMSGDWQKRVKDNRIIFGLGSFGKIIEVSTRVSH